MLVLRLRLPLVVGALLGPAFGLTAARGEEPAGNPAAVTRPVVPGFERFFSGPDADAARGGSLLLGELNCTSCHKAGEAQQAAIVRKQAPILDEVGRRVRVEYLRQFITDPRQTKPGTTMPNLLAGLPENERAATVEALVHFLASTGSVVEVAPDRKFARHGQDLFHQVGCTACHAPRVGGPLNGTISVPLGDLALKYSIDSLIRFLKNPLHVRPSGRMPGPNLKDDEVRDIAHYLLEDLQVESLGKQNLPKIAYSYYEGDFNDLPDFDKLTPKKSGLGGAFDVSIAPQSDHFALKFEGVFEAPHEGDYRFDLASDDGSRLWVDDTLVVDNGGIHAKTNKEGRAHLAAGVHRVRVAYFEQGGGEELELKIAGPALPQQPLSNLVAAGEDELRKKHSGQPKKEAPKVFRLDPALATKGRELFASIGCASCHHFRQNGQRIETVAATAAKAKPLDTLATQGGCLAESPQPHAPFFGMNEAQRKAVAAVIEQLKQPPPTPIAQADGIDRTMVRFNCYACHERGGKGGVEQARNALFSTTQKEMGDEGRIPPKLDGVGAKLTTNYLKRIAANGANDRPYMRTRMPRYGEANIGPLVAAFEQADPPVPPVEIPTFERPERRVKADGRHLVGDKAFGCVKCHNFKGVQATGVQSIDLTLMPQRLKHDWFHRYLLNPQEFRRGTRMPAAWPRGRSTIQDVLDGDATKQIESIWLYLSDPNPAVPYGLSREMIELAAGKEAVIYRNFLHDVSPRGIAVAYPEKANLAFDAENVRLALIWQGPFIDASMHWTGRGNGNQQPLGDAVVSLPKEPAFATLDSPDAAWPTTSAREAGYHFRGYRVSPDQRPTFLYDLSGVHVEDFPTGVAGEPYPSLRRTLTLTADGPPGNLYFRAAVSPEIESLGDGWYALDKHRKMRLESAASPLVVSVNGHKELRVPVPFQNGKAQITQEFVW